MRAAIIDYGMGNVASVRKALNYVGVAADITRNSNDIIGSDFIVLPGVGSFAEGMRNLHAFKLADVLTEAVMIKKKPFLGICLGMQLIASTGYEPVEIQGLGWIKGAVKKIPAAGKRIPHMGWNNVAVSGNGFFEGLNNPDFYFIHSYYFEAEEKKNISSTVDYGITMAASLEQENIFATQFHPEKSQQAGLTVLKNFIRIKCLR